MAELVTKGPVEIGELDFSLNSFNQQKVLRGVYAYARLIDRLLRKRKGTNPSEPNMGIDLDSYRFMAIDTLVAGTLKDNIMNQISTYIPDLPLSDVNIDAIRIKGDTVLYITISLLDQSTKINAAYLQRKRNIIGTKVTVENRPVIGSAARTTTTTITVPRRKQRYRLWLKKQHKAIRQQRNPLQNVQKMKRFLLVRVCKNPMNMLV